MVTQDNVYSIIAMLALFEKHNVLNYIKECYGALHTTGSQYIVDNIDEFIGNVP